MPNIPTVKLGKLPPVRPPGLKDLSAYATLPPPPPTSLGLARTPWESWGMDCNDVIGDCITEGTLVSGPKPRKVVRSRYSGPVITLKFASGKHLTVTPNHAILTPRGFTRARFLKQGDDVVSTCWTQNTELDIDQTPTAIEDIFATFQRGRPTASQLAPRRLMRGAVDFHGDELFMYGDVDIEGAEGLLQGELDSTLCQPHSQHQIANSAQLQASFHSAGTSGRGSRRLATAAASSISGRGDSLALFNSHGSVAEAQLGTLSSQGHASGGKKPLEPLHMDPRLSRQSHYPLSCLVARNDSIQVGGGSPVVEKPITSGCAPDFYASSLQPSGEGAMTDPHLFSNLSDRFPGVVSTDRVLDIDIHQHVGHIFDLSTDTRWYSANDIISHNCVLAGADHQLASWNELSTVQTPRPTDPEIQSLYFELTGGPDSGLVVSSVLNIWQTQGLWGSKIAAYAPVPLGDKTALQQAIVNYGNVGIGIQCPASAQEAAFDPQIWSVVPGSPIVGGHYIVAVGYDANAFYCASWGYLWAVTWDFITTYSDEMWVAIAPEFVEAGKGPTLDLAALQADLGQV